MAFLIKRNNIRNIAFCVRNYSSSTVEIEYKNAKPFNSIPGPKSTFELVKLFMLPGSKYANKPFNEMLQLLKEDYGSICYFPGMFGSKPLVLTYQPEDAEKVFRAEGKWPYRRPLDSFVYYRRNYRQDIFKTSGGLLAEDGFAWHDMRTKVNQIMMQPKNTKFYIPGIDQVSQDFVKLMHQIRNEKMEMPSDFFESLNQWALESISLIALDTRLGLFEGKNPQAQKIYDLVKKLFAAFYEFDIMPSIWRYYKTPGFKKAMKSCDEMTEIIYEFVNKAVEKYEKDPSQSKDGVLEKLLKVDKNLAIIMCLDMLGAGIDTTSASTAAVLYNLAKHPEKQEKLREEIFKILPSKKTQLDVNDLDHVPYLRAVIKEALRLNPIFSGNARAAEYDLILQGYQVPKGVDIMVVTCSHKDHFERVDEFIPERWLKDNVDAKCPHAKDAHPFAFLPFGFASRACIGKRMANMEIEIITARILREFKLEWHQPDLKWKSTTINIPDTPLKFKVIDI